MSRIIEPGVGRGRWTRRKYPLDSAHPYVSPCPMTGCWLWLGAVTQNGGYGVTNSNRRFLRAHRAFWEAANGPIPDGLVLDHTCRVKSCVNPDHLRAVTPRVNSIENNDGPAAWFAGRANCHRCSGPLSPRAYKTNKGKMRWARKCLACTRKRTATNQRRYRELAKQ